MSTSTRAFTLYRFFDANGVLLYVGRTVDARSRWRTHEKTKEWFDRVATVTREVHPDADALDQAERMAIRNEAPLYNIHHNGKRAGVDSTPRSDWTRDELFLARLVTRAEPDAATGAVQIERPKPCGRADSVESCCECFDCHVLREQFLERLLEDYLGDPSIQASVTDIRARYAAGEDLDLFPGRRLGVHEHFLRSGDYIGADLTPPCDPNARYLPVLDLDRATDGFHRWLDGEARRRRRAS